jgi:hypothetical protein
MRKVLAIPLDEVRQHFARNAGQDVKIVGPEILAAKLAEKLKARGKPVKPERPLARNEWTHVEGDVPNWLCDAHEFAAGLPDESLGPFALCFGNEKAERDAHSHPRHLEIYFSEPSLEAEYRSQPDAPVERLKLAQGGAFVFAAGVPHRARLGGLTLVIEIPAVADDKVVEAL